jgi:hypothetical protein
MMRSIVRRVTVPRGTARPLPKLMKNLPLGRLLENKCRELGIDHRCFLATVRCLVARGGYRPDSIRALTSDDADVIRRDAAAVPRTIPSLGAGPLANAFAEKCRELAIRKHLQPTLRVHLIARGKWTIASIQAITPAQAIEISKWPCAWCGRGLTLARISRQFCSERCKIVALNDRHRVRHPEKQCALALLEGSPTHSHQSVHPRSTAAPNTESAGGICPFGNRTRRWSARHL